MQRVIGLEGGATRTDWVYLEVAPGGAVRRLDGGRLPGANYVLIARDALAGLLRSLPADPTHVGLYLAGCRTREDGTALRTLALEVWPRAHITTGGDRESGFAAAFKDDDGIVVIAGTGSAVHGRRGAQVDRAGGWGQLLGDRGSGFDIAVHGLRHCLRMFDVEQRTLPLAHAFLHELGLNTLNELVQWAQDADKFAIARLAPIVFETEANGDDDLRLILDVCARRLAEYAGAVARRLAFDAPEVRLLGGVFAHQPTYVERFTRQLLRHTPRARVEVCTVSGAMGAAWLATRGAPAGSVPEPEQAPAAVPDRAGELAMADTEQVHPDAAELHTLDTSTLVSRFVADEAGVGRALAAARPALEAAVDLVQAALAGGGRLFYVGAGTSGRLGVLDASEIPPTFGTSPETVQGLIAGGVRALQHSVEGAEDSAAGGSAAVTDRGAAQGDVVCGITAGGGTPFVLGALDRARALGARTMLITCNPSRRRRAPGWDVEIDLPTGPELIAGSTRLKAGTATKVALNIISSCAMIRLGRVAGPLMVDFRATNDKLRDRAARMVSAVRGCSYEEARQALAAAEWNVRACLEGRD